MEIRPIGYYIKESFVQNLLQKEAFVKNQFLYRSFMSDFDLTIDLNDFSLIFCHHLDIYSQQTSECVGHHLTV